MECECCHVKIKDERNYFEHQLVTGTIIACESCYEALHDGPTDTYETSITMSELSAALPS
jgi:hypothetical protein